MMEYLLKKMWSRLSPERLFWKHRVLDWSEKKMIPFSLAPPRLVYIELASVCNLKCPVCPTGTKTHQRGDEFIKPDLFRKIVDNLGPFHPYGTFQIWGESLLHPEVSNLIRYAKDHGFLDITINTNGNINKPYSWFKELVASGIDDLIVAVDGSDQKSYEAYRRAGSLDNVLRFFAMICQAKQEANSSLPRISPLMVVNRFNVEQEEQIRQLLAPFDVAPLRKRNFNIFNMHENIPAEVYLDYLPNPADSRFEKTPQGGLTVRSLVSSPQRLACYGLWQYLHISVNGHYLPCCSAWENEPAMGTLNEMMPIDFWFSKTMTNYRKRNLDDPLSIPLCQRCVYIKRNRGISV
ncbi:MAG: radical SAM protein [Magnetococcales bacterium]|nr:radical SAM protein [Magnetococcales bacterium]